jgi:hypothetical protein
METTKQTYSEEDRNMGLISKATRSDTMIVNQLTKSEMITNALDECRNEFWCSGCWAPEFTPSF